MKGYGFVAILVAIAVLGIASLVCLTWYGPLDLSESIEIGILVVLILVTISYAYSTKGIQNATTDQVTATREQAEISRQATEIALNAAKNAVLPIVMLVLDGGSMTRLETGEFHVKSTGVRFMNIGKGPALNIKVWLEYVDDEFGDPTRSHTKHTTVLAIEKEAHFFWIFEEENLAPPGQAYGYKVFAEYTDVYEQNFRSCLIWLPETPSEFFFGRAPEVEDPIETH